MAVLFFLLAVTLAPLRWGGDAEGGAPFVEADPRDPSQLRGFDVEVAGEIAKGLGRQPEFVQVAFNEIDQSVERGDFDIGMSGVEDTPARHAAATPHSATCTSAPTDPWVSPAATCASAIVRSQFACTPTYASCAATT